MRTRFPHENITTLIFSFEKYKAIYFRVPKVASTSLLITFRQIDNIEKIGLDYDKSLFKFAFVRNPFDRLISCFKHVIQKGALERINDDPKFYREMPFNEFVQQINQQTTQQMDIHVRPQYTYIPEKPDFLGRFESLEEDFKKLCEKLNVRLDLPHKNFTHKTNYKDYYDDKTLELVQKIYEKDFNIFGYSKDL